MNIIDADKLIAWIEERAHGSLNKPFKDDLKGTKPEWRVSEAEILLLTELKKFVLSNSKDSGEGDIMVSASAIKFHELQNELKELRESSELINENTFLAGYKKRCEQSGVLYDFASELAARSYYIKYKSSLKQKYREKHSNNR